MNFHQKIITIIEDSKNAILLFANQRLKVVSINMKFNMIFFLLRSDKVSDNDRCEEGVDAGHVLQEREGGQVRGQKYYGQGLRALCLLSEIQKQGVAVQY